MKIRTLFLAAAIVVSSVAIVQSQEPRLRVFVEEQFVVVDAFDRAGNRIDTLGSADFVVSQNGAAAPIRSFELKRDETTKDGPIAMSLILCNKHCLSIEALRQAASNLLHLLQKDDRVALYTICPEPARIAEFTSDLEHLQKVVGEVFLNPCAPRLHDMLVMGIEDLAAAKETNKDHVRILAMISGDHIPFSTTVVQDPDTPDSSRYVYEYGGPIFDALAGSMVEHEIKFFDISRGNEPQKNFAEVSGGRSINVDRLAGGTPDGAIAALKELRARKAPFHRYVIGFLPTTIGEIGTVMVTLSPHFGTIGRDYTLVVQKPVIKKPPQ